MIPSLTFIVCIGHSPLTNFLMPWTLVQSLEVVSSSLRIVLISRVLSGECPNNIFTRAWVFHPHIPCDLLTSPTVPLTLGCTYWLSWLYNSTAIKQVSYWIVGRPLLHCHKKSQTSWWCFYCIWCVFSCPHSLQTDTKLCYHCFISNLSLSLPPLYHLSCSHDVCSLPWLDTWPDCALQWHDDLQKCWEAF